jgi:hypothetical protein
MSSTYLTLLQDAIHQAKEDETFQSFETRGSQYGAVDIAMEQTNKLLPKKKIDACSFSGAGATTSQTLVWQPFVEGFSLSYSEMKDNRYTYEELFNLRWREKMKALYKRIDAYIIARLEASYSAGAGTVFPTFNDARQVALSEWDLAQNRAANWINKARANFRMDDFSGDNLHILGDAFMSSVLSATLNQGAGTATNTGFQFQGITSNFTNRITNNIGIDATGYLFEKGAFGMLDWCAPIFREGMTNGTDVWMSQKDPRYGMTLGVKVTKECKDNSAINSKYTADWNESWQFGVEVSVPMAYDSEGGSFVRKYELANDNTVQSGSGSYSE